MDKEKRKEQREGPQSREVSRQARKKKQKPPKTLPLKEKGDTSEKRPSKI